jgi:hypothetical protein
LALTFVIVTYTLTRLSFPTPFFVHPRETIEQIKENPYLQYFLGMSSYSNETPFDASLMVYFRERIDLNSVNEVNEKMVKNFREKEEQERKKNESGQGEEENKGKLILDASCAPGDIISSTDNHLK